MTRHTLPVAVHVFLLRGEHVLLLRRHNTGYEDGNYSVPAGHLDGGESVIAAAVREAREETGIRIAHNDIQVVGVMHRLPSDGDRIDFFVSAATWDGEPTNMEPEKCDRLAWFPMDQLPENTIPYIRSGVEAYRSGEWFTLFGWAAGR